MRSAIYNSGIPNFIPRLVNRALLFVSRLRGAGQVFLILIAVPPVAGAVDLSGPELQLARKIVAVTGPGAVTLTVENRSSLARRENEAVQNGLRSALEGLGLHFVKEEQGAATVASQCHLSRRGRDPMVGQASARDQGRVVATDGRRFACRPQWFS